MACTHYRPQARNFACDAFPFGIPQGIIDSEIDHRVPIEGDNNIHFRQDSSKPVPRAFRLFDTSVA